MSEPRVLSEAEVEFAMTGVRLVVDARKTLADVEREYTRRMTKLGLDPAKNYRLAPDQPAEEVTP